MPQNGLNFFFLIHDVDKSTLVLGFQYLFSVSSLSLAQKIFFFKVEKKVFWKCSLRILKKVSNFAINLLWQKKVFLKLILHWSYTGVRFSIAFLCSIFELCTENILKKLGQNCFENVVSEYWKNCKFGHKFTLKKSIFKTNFTILVLINFWEFLLLCGLVLNIFTFFFSGSEGCLERCDSYGNFGYLEKIQHFYSRRIL